MFLRAMLLLQVQAFMIRLQAVGGSQQQQQTPAPAVAQLTSRLLEESCHSQAENFTAFYLSVRERQAAERKFPLWPNGILR